MSDLRIYKRGDTWHIRGTLCGVRVRKSTGTSSREHAEATRLKIEKDILDRHHFGPEKTSTFAEAAVLYLEGGGESRFLEPAIDWFGLKRIRDITQADIIRFAAETYPGIGAHGLNRQAFTPIIAVIRAAAKAGLCTMPTFTRPKQKKKKKVVEYADNEWLVAFLDAAKPNPNLYAITLFLTTTGARVSEACALDRKDLNERRRTALLRHTKNGDARTVNLSDPVWKAVQAIPVRPKQTRVFGYRSRFSVNQAIERVCSRAGLQYLSSHKLGRHAFAARMLDQGHTVKMVQEAGGWKSFRMVSDVYGHLEQSKVIDAIATANTALERDLEPLAIGDPRLPEVPVGRAGVYIISSGGYFKIGKTTSLERRMVALRDGSPLPIRFHYLELMPDISTAHAVEQEAHAVLSEWRQAGEWFSCSLEAATLAVTQASDQIAPDRFGKLSTQEHFLRVNKEAGCDSLLIEDKRETDGGH